jgi:hypothetical protein
LSVSPIIRLSTDPERRHSRHPDEGRAESASPQPAELDRPVLAAMLEELTRNADRVPLSTNHRGLADRVFGLLEGSERTIARLRARGWTAGDLAAGLRLRRADVDDMQAEALDRLRSRLLADEKLHRMVWRAVGDPAHSRGSIGPSRQTQTTPHTPERTAS